MPNSNSNSTSSPPSPPFDFEALISRATSTGRTDTDGQKYEICRQLGHIIIDTIADFDKTQNKNQQLSTQDEFGVLAIVLASALKRYSSDQKTNILLAYKLCAMVMEIVGERKKEGGN